MRFKVDGDVFELTPDSVRAKLDGRTPESILRHWVEIDGVPWPVKQALSAATGVSPRRFQPSTARRHLRNLGFTVSAASASKPATLPLSGPRMTPFDMSALTMMETVNVSVEFVWLRAGAVTLDENGFPSFPPLPGRAGLYRFDFGTDSTGSRVFYVGESKDLNNRASQYRRAKADRRRALTSRRLHRRMVEHLMSGSGIDMAIATEAHLADGSAVNLGRKSGRLLAESAAVVLAQLDPRIRLLNIDADLGSDDTEASDLIRPVEPAGS